MGKPRAEATLPRLAELNAYVPVRNLGGRAGQEITIDLIQGFQVRLLGLIAGKFHVDWFLQVVVLCGVSLEKQLEINDWTHKNGVHFIAAETRGLFGFVRTVSSCFSFSDRYLWLIGLFSTILALDSPVWIVRESSLCPE